ncbi:polar amino acid transport system substrate-binding protein [Inhella inkyongensis]|uniref:Polar amino acid transport system substrate-binding protein n=1 Tax=Inhella inkyongensis TaxID=392593 RepID=A0A840S5F2_9BURK|nr:transporter substrate-binding domain-containing protein [Inhella inkyongensis]MBB5204708.1 polar amino acid transport system substrate-binding protein [Inhella inkyongensis]
MRNAWVCGLALALTWSAGAQAQGRPALDGGVVRACDDANEWPPYTQRDTHSPLGVGGYSVDVLRKILARHGLNLEIVLLPWRRCLEEVRQGQRFVMLLNAARTPQRERDYWLSEPYYETRTHYLWSLRTHPKGLDLRSAEDLRPLRMGAVAGYESLNLDRWGLTVHSRAPNFVSLIQMLHRDRIDSVLVAEEMFRLGPDGRVQPPWDDAELGHAALPGALTTPFHMLFSRRNPQGEALRALVNHELSSLRRSGELQRLLKAYLPSR